MIDLHERLSEYSYGYGITRETEKLLENTGIRAVPFLPNLIQENDLGFDVGFNRPGVALLLQFKLGHSLKVFRRTDLSVPPPILDRPYWRFNAHDLERMVCAELAKLLSDARKICTLIGPADARQTEKAIFNARNLAQQLDGGQSHAKQNALQKLLGGVQLHDSHIELSVDPVKLVSVLGIDQSVSSAGSPYIITCKAVRVRRGHELRLTIPSSAVAPIAVSRDEKLIGLLAEAHAAAELITANPELPLAKIAAQHGKCRTRLGKLVALSCLAPDIVTAIVQGRQPATLNARRMMQLTLPVDWSRQRAMLGFA